MLTLKVSLKSMTSKKENQSTESRPIQVLQTLLMELEVKDLNMEPLNLLQEELMDVSESGIQGKRPRWSALSRHKMRKLSLTAGQSNLGMHITGRNDA